MKIAVLAVLAVVVALADAHTWLVSPRSRGTEPGGQLPLWQANTPPCSQMSKTSGGVTYDTTKVQVVAGYTAGDTVTVTWFDEHAGPSGVVWPNCNDQAQLMNIELGDSADAPTNFQLLASACAADLSTDVVIPANLASDTYTVRMRWDFLDQIRAQTGNPGHNGPLVFYDCADVTVDQPITEEGVSAADAAALIRQYAWILLLLALCPIGACLVYAQRQKVVSSRMTRMTAASMMSADSSYADVKSDRGSTGISSGGNRTTMMSAMTGDSTGSGKYSSGMTGITGMTGDKTASMYTNTTRGSGGSRGSGGRKSRGSHGRSSGGSSGGGSGGRRSRGSRA